MAFPIFSFVFLRFFSLAKIVIACNEFLVRLLHSLALAVAALRGHANS